MKFLKECCKEIDKAFTVFFVSVFIGAGFTLGACICIAFLYGLAQ